MTDGLPFNTARSYSWTILIVDIAILNYIFDVTFFDACTSRVISYYFVERVLLLFMRAIYEIYVQKEKLVLLEKREYILEYRIGNSTFVRCGASETTSKRLSSEVVSSTLSQNYELVNKMLSIVRYIVVGSVKLNMNASARVGSGGSSKVKDEIEADSERDKKSLQEHWDGNFRHDS